MVILEFQGFHGTMITEILIIHFPDKENTGDLPKTIKNMFYTENLPLALGKF